MASSHPAAAAPAASPARSARHAIGAAALAVGVLGTAVGAAGALIQPGLVAAGTDLASMQAMIAGRFVVTGLLGLVAVLLGVVAVIVSPRRALAAAGIALGAVLLLDVVVGLLVQALLLFG